MATFATLDDAWNNVVKTLDQAVVDGKLEGGWIHRLNAETLDQSIGTLCILAQLFGTFLEGADTLDIVNRGISAFDQPFTSVGDYYGMNELTNFYAQKIREAQESTQPIGIATVCFATTSGIEITVKLPFTDFTTVHKEALNLIQVPQSDVRVVDTQFTYNDSEE